MGDPGGAFTNKEVAHLTDKQKLKLRLEVVRALLKNVHSVKLREKLAKRFKIKLGR